MKASKSTSSTLTRVLALPLTAGLLAGCDYASKLPEAPSTLGYELQAQKPPSVTEPPAEVAALAPPPRIGGGGLDTQALRVSPQGLEVPRSALALPPSGALPPPSSQALIGPPPPPRSAPAMRDADGYVPPAAMANNSYQGPQLGVPMAPQGQTAQYSPIPFDEEPLDSVPFDAGPFNPEPFNPEPVAIASLPGAPLDTGPTFGTQTFESQAFEPQESSILYSAAPLAQPLTQPSAQPLAYGTAIAQDTTIATIPYSAPAPMAAPSSPITVLHTRLDNGAVVSVHPVVGAPGATSMALARAIASELGASVDRSALSLAPAIFDLRASASQGGGRAEAEWKLFSSSGALVGTFPESERNGNWTTMGDDAVQAMGRRVASRLRRNADLRRATLTSLASAPSITTIDYGTLLPSGAPSLAPMPRQRPAPVTFAVAPMQAAPMQAAPMQAAPVQMAPVQVAPLQMAPVQIEPVRMASVQPAAPTYVINTAPMIDADPMANAIPRRRPQGVRTASLSPTALPSPIPQPLAVQPAPLQTQTMRVAPPQIAPLQPAPLQAAPMQAAPLQAAPPPPSFDTLRAATTQMADGPRSLVFRGVRGAPGNGDQALGREVSRLLGQSGAQLAPSGTPNALYLTADVSRDRNGASDRIKIMWHVEEADGTRVGQVVQENDVPAGALDSNWGEDAFYAAQGARDGIMELLRTSGAIDA